MADEGIEPSPTEAREVREIRELSQALVNAARRALAATPAELDAVSAMAREQARELERARRADEANFRELFTGTIPDPDPPEVFTPATLERALRTLQETRVPKWQPQTIVVSPQQYERLRTLLPQGDASNPLGQVVANLVVDPVRTDSDATVISQRNARVPVEIESLAIDAERGWYDKPKYTPEQIECFKRLAGVDMPTEWRRQALYRACDVCHANNRACGACNMRGYYSRPGVSVETLRARATPAFTMAEVLPLP